MWLGVAVLWTVFASIAGRRNADMIALIMFFPALATFCYGVYANVSQIHRRIKDIRGTAENANLFTAGAIILTFVPVLNAILGFTMVFWPGQAYKRASGAPTPDSPPDYDGEYEEEYKAA